MLLIRHAVWCIKFVLEMKPARILVESWGTCLKCPWFSQSLLVNQNCKQAMPHSPTWFPMAQANCYKSGRSLNFAHVAVASNFVSATQFQFRRSQGHVFLYSHTPLSYSVTEPQDNTRHYINRAAGTKTKTDWINSQNMFVFTQLNPKQPHLLATPVSRLAI
jgi:hypothetical protein